METFALVAADCICAPQSESLVVKVEVAVFSDPVEVVLDGKYSYEATEDKDYDFSTHSSTDFQPLYINLAIRPGKRLVDADYGGGSISKRILIGEGSSRKRNV